MGDRANLLNRSSGVVIADEAPPTGGRPRPGANGAVEKRPAPGAGDGNPAAKKQRTTHEDEFDKLLQSIPTDPETRKRELRGLANKTVERLPMGDLNYYLQAIKKAVEQKKAKKQNAKQEEQQANQQPPPASATAETEGDKPNLSGSFYPLNNLQAEGEKKEEKEKVFQRAKTEKRSPEEEQQFQDLLHSLSDNPVVRDDALDEGRFEEVLTSALLLCKKLKDWFQLWSHCLIKGEITIGATVYLANKLCLEKEEEEVADILAHLMKEKEIGPKHMESAISQFQIGARNMTDIVGHLLVFIYPTAKNDFGWSRVGWGFAQWWGQCKKLVKVLTPEKEAVGALKMVVDKLLFYKADFEPEKQEKMLVKAIELTGSRAAACDALGIFGDDTVKPSPSPLSTEENA
mmetsp:Transcript_4991/g.12530  ORF Transcript_4991/g.12530 Transcript_4991/m.12530 type:complete len:403 (-) Transcript_4991:604-1812(-)|eukprot:CAMPEP_0178998472 /NCGR_PEP_ID=MMETSP0795-20121207/9529_1 /TAXON_ID=88552 /ORGANISM="Amoebophrya sp., Strain Ameob2" /LENGTH=402 /DNA_ID=CAMNT_0020691149 /DNA_START=480 /DNA_END=1688 /DNA_ORIENTATION=-